MPPPHHLAASLGLLLVILGTALALEQAQGSALANRGRGSSDERATDNPSNLTTSQGSRHVKPHAQTIMKPCLEI